MQFLAILLFLTPAGVEQFQTTLPAPLAACRAFLDKARAEPEQEHHIYLGGACVPTEDEAS